MSLTPTRHGNWRVINGELVDLDAIDPRALPEPPADAGPEGEDSPPPIHSRFWRNATED